MKDREVARNVAGRLRALAGDMGERQAIDPRATMLSNAFLAAAGALETARRPPPRHQVLALVQVLTAGFEKLSTPPFPRLPAGANDLGRAP